MYQIRVYAFGSDGYQYSFSLHTGELDRKRLLHKARRIIRENNRMNMVKARLVSFGRKMDGVRV